MIEPQSKNEPPLFAGRAQEMDSPTRTLPPAVTVLAVAAVLGLAAAAFLYVTRPKPAAKGSIVRVLSVEPSAGRTLVGIEVNLQNLYRKEIWVHQIEVKTTTPDGEFSDTPAPAADLPGYFKAFPDIASDKQPLIENVKIQPGQQLTGFVLVAFPTAKDDFDKRKSLEVTIDLYDQRPIVVSEKK